MIKEELLHYLWQHQFFNKNDLFTQTGEKIEIVHPGSLNKHSGPDFFNAQVRLDNLLWVGNVEIHCNSSDWYKHQHQDDKAYTKLILHVVWKHDREVYRSDGSLLPVLVLNGRVKKKLIDQYDQMLSSMSWVPCANLLDSVPSIYIEQMLNRMAIERLERKADRIQQLLKLHKNDWESVFYQLLARAFGFKVNALPFELLAVHTPFKLVRKCNHSKIKLSALLFGQAGFLESQSLDEYHEKLKGEYQFLKRLFHLKPMDASLWKFLRMRPSNFPTRRIAQFIELYFQQSKLFAQVQRSSSILDLKDLFEIELDQYWFKHYHFGKQLRKGEVKKLGSISKEILIINVIVPMLFCWQKVHAKSEPEEVLRILEQLAAENNSIIRGWRSVGLKIENAFDSQAALELKQAFCMSKKCLQCTIGSKLLR